MFRTCCLALFGLLLHACATSDGLKTVSVGERNVDNLQRLNLGMTETQVLGIMRDPYKEESFQVDEDHYDVLFYVTTVTVMGQTRMVPLNLTPLTFKNRILVGMGYVYYRWLQETHAAKAPPPAPQPQIENATSFYIPPREMFSMCMPRKDAPSEERTDPPPPPKEPPPQKNPDVKINEKDEQMIEDEQDQNFDFW